MSQEELKRGLSNRHIQLIALGGAVGTGLFLGVASSVAIAGPSVLLGYFLAGIIAFMIMRQLGEMVVEEPVAGSFSHFAYRYWGNFQGFTSGWNYWILYILVSMAELTAIGKYVHFWYPEIPLWASTAFFFVLINVINLSNVRFYGEAEFWLSIIKIVAILGMIVFGTGLLITGAAGPEASVSNLWRNGGFFPYGITGMFMSMAIIMFSFGGLELIGITAAEANDPEKSIPKATNQVIYRILIFYIGALSILLALYPWNQISSDSSPFVMIFASLETNLNFSLFGHTYHVTNMVAHVLNFVVLTAALSVYNSSLYCSSRMLYGLAQQKNAPKFLNKVNKQAVPTSAILLSSLIVGSCILLNYMMPNDAFNYLMALVVSALLINWAMISLTHLKFRKARQKQSGEIKFKSFWYPFSNYICLVFLASMLVIMWLTGMTTQVILIPIWLLVLCAIYYFTRHQREEHA